MPDRLQAIVVEPRDPAVPIDVQGVNLRRKAITAMQALGSVDENTVRYKGGTEDATVSLNGTMMSLWQRNLMAALFYADGRADKSLETSTVRDEDHREFSAASVVRDPYSK
ncbi:hypothetical protein CM07_gp60 [Mycobacterium phage Alma]|uniref:Uncharacterized protein n=1 Tax=Mycobacterium phage Alma TaxID=2902800 RepID=G8I7R5_9CAUD|nr:hypothetical protein CM07_gp60 [Mycobacterium phage Alma]AER48755.1 hypothetical protein ALMA_46 [Mycobacterium phage Alma]